MKLELNFAGYEPEISVWEFLFFGAGEFGGLL